MVPTLVLTALLSTALPALEPTSVRESQPRMERVESVASEGQDDGFASDTTGFPPRRAELPSRETSRGWESPLRVARTFVGVWVAASALFGLIWGLLGWATRSRLGVRA